MKLIGFPTDGGTRQMLACLGDDYPATLARNVEAGIVIRDPGTRVVEIECLEPPRFETPRRRTSASRTKATIPLRIRFVDSHGRGWNMFLAVEVLGESLGDPPSPYFKLAFHHERTEWLDE